MGRYRTPGEAKVVLTGSINGGKKTFEYGAAMSGQNKAADFIPRLWAIRKVGYLLEEIRLRGERAELKDECTMLGKKFGIVTPYTSYLVVEDVPVPVANNRGFDDRRPGERPPPPPAPVQQPWASAPRDEASERFAPMKKEAAKPKAMDEKSRNNAPATVAAEPEMDSSDFAAAFGGPRGGAGQGKGDLGALGSSSGSEGIAVSKATRGMKDYDKGPASSDPVRVAGGRTYIFRSGGWIDSEAITGTPKTLKVKYLSEGYFALLKARPDLKAGIALGNRVVVLVANGKSVVIAPNEGEEKADKVESFLK
jgi:Ca-activated chloride channel family protein